MTGTTPRELPLPRYVREDPAVRTPVGFPDYRSTGLRAPLRTPVDPPPRLHQARRPPRRLPRPPRPGPGGAPADAGRPAAPADRGHRPGARRGSGEAHRRRSHLAQRPRGGRAADPGARAGARQRRPPGARRAGRGGAGQRPRPRPGRRGPPGRPPAGARRRVRRRVLWRGRVPDSGGRPVPGALVEVWQANASGRYRHVVDTWPAPLDPHFDGLGRVVTDSLGRYEFLTVKPGAYPWGNHHNAWRPAHIHFSLFGRAFTQRRVAQRYFPGDPLFGQDPIFNAIPAAARHRAVSRFSLERTQA